MHEDSGAMRRAGSDGRATKVTVLGATELDSESNVPLPPPLHSDNTGHSC